MKPFKKLLTLITLGGIATGGMMLGNNLVRDVQFARAQEKVNTSREQLAKADDLATVFREVSKALEPSVVNINVRKTVKGVSRSLPFDDDTLKRFFPDRDGDGEPDVPGGMGGQPFEQIGTGSGVIMETDGSTAYLLTNNHVAGDASEMIITLSDGREITNGKVIGTDPKTDLAVVRIQQDHLIPAKWGDSDVLQKGDWIVAFGSPFGYVGSMTHGIVSALNRQTNQGGAGILGRYGYENFIQVDAPINPGNSGGPLVNLRGEVVGINTAIASQSGGFQGIGFAIPSNQAKFVYGQLKEKGKVVRGWLGVGIKDVAQPDAREVAKSFGYEGRDGILVEQVFPNTPSSGKLKHGDVITALNGKDVKTTSELRNQIAAIAPNSEITLKAFREGKSEDVKIKLGEQPDDLVAMGGKESGEKNEATSEENATKTKIGATLVDVDDKFVQEFGLEEKTKGALVNGVTPRSVAARSGLRPGDVITEVGKEPVTSAKEAHAALAKVDMSKGVRLYVVSRDASRFVFLKPEVK